MKAIILLRTSTLLLLGFDLYSSQTEAIQPNCSDVVAEERTICMVSDPAGITDSSVCHNLSCCWNLTETNQTLRCFNKSIQGTGNHGTGNATQRTQVMLPTCSAITAEEKVGCVPHTNATVCQLIGCCWNPTETNHALRCFTKRGGTCLPYRGKICRQSLNTTLPDYRNSKRFFDNKFGLLGTEQFLATAMEVINDFVKNNEKCRYIIANAICHYTLAPCYQGTNTVMQYCRNDCEAIYNDCREEMNQVIGAMKFHETTEGIDFVHTEIPDCTKLRPFEYYQEKQNETCIMTGFFDNTKSTVATTLPGGEKLHIIIPLIFVGLLIIACAIVFFLWRRKQNAIFQDAPVTVRDRLREESIKSLDFMQLALYGANKPMQCRLDHVVYVKDLGEGFFGKVFQGRAMGVIENQPKEEVAVAVKALKDDPSKEQKDEFFREVNLMSMLAHPNIVRLLAVSTEEEPYGMVFEFMSKGDLNQYLRNSLPAETALDPDDMSKVYLAHEDLVSISVQIAAGMQYLTEMKLVHRDLATRNCLVGEGLVVKIADFGMSRDIYTSEYYKITKETTLPIRWLAPEAILYGISTMKTDVYAYGVVLWEIFTFGLQPYYGHTNKKVMDFIQEGIHLGKPDNCPDFVYAIMKDCWIREPERRAEFSAISMRLKTPYHSYYLPPSSDSEDEPDGHSMEETQEKKNYDVPRNTAASDYDIPRASADEDTDDVHRSHDDLRMNNADVANDIPL